jgi:protein-disulfide isomerase
MNKLLTMAFFLPMLATAAPTPFTSEQQQAIERTVLAQIQNHPEAIITSLQNYQKEALKNEQDKTATVAKTMKEQLVFNSMDPSIGPQKATITLVEFSDYQCGHCRHMAEVVNQLMQQDHDLRLVVKELPIFQGNSLLAAKAAMAAAQQGSFKAMHEAIFQHKGVLDDQALTTLATSAHLNITLFNQARASDAIASHIERNFAAAKALNLQGTPAFILFSTFGDQLAVLPGAVSIDTLRAEIKKLRS